MTLLLASLERRNRINIASSVNDNGVDEVSNNSTRALIPPSFAIETPQSFSFAIFLNIVIANSCTSLFDISSISGVIIPSFKAIAFDLESDLILCDN